LLKVRQQATKKVRYVVAIWNWFNCYLSGRHDYGVACKPGTIYLSCIHCGRHSSGWAIDAKPPRQTAVTSGRESNAIVAGLTAAARSARVLPFDRAAG